MTSPVVLCVDDERPVLDSLRRDLSRHGFEVLSARGGGEALPMVAAHEIDAAIVDLRLDGEDGIALLAELANRVPGAVRVLLTGAGDYRASVRAINEGRVFALMEKPWSADSLASTLSAGIEVNRSNVAQAALRAPAAGHARKRLSDDAWQLLQALDVFESPRKQGHGRRVAELLGAFCRHIGISDSHAQEAQAAALVHDLGESLLSEATRRTPHWRLSGEALREFQSHPETGARLLGGLDGLKASANIVALHHEQHDGKGFPRGLSGEAIPAVVRIFQVADAYDELQIGGAGQRKLSAEEARRELEQGAGKQFDPRAVRAFVRWAAQTCENRDAGPGLPIAELRPGMVLSEDLTTPDGLLLVPAGHRLTEALLGRISALAANLPELRAKVRA